MEKIRSFIAIEIDEGTRSKVVEIQSKLRGSGADLKLVEPGNIHLTLHFLGNVEVSKLEALKSFLDKKLGKFKPFSFKPQGLGAFPSMRNPRVIWVGVDVGKEYLKQIYEAIKEELEKLGIKVEERKFHPHITIARSRSPKGNFHLIKILGELEIPEFGEIKVSKISLFKSTLTSKGPIYEILYRWELKP